MNNTHGGKPHVLVLGGGSVGLTTAADLRKTLGTEVAITIVDSRPYMTYQPFLPEVGAGSIDPRNVLAPLRKILAGTKVVTGSVTKIRSAENVVVVDTEDDVQLEISYDYLVVGLGAVPRLLPIPGLAEAAIGFKWVEEAVAVRDRILANLAEAASTKDPKIRKRLLTFTFVGGGFAGGEAIAETEDMVRDALRYYPDLHASDIRFVLIDAAPFIFPELTEDQRAYVLNQLRERGIEVKLETFLNSAEDGVVKTSDGDEFETDLLVWNAGVKPSPILLEEGASDLPVITERGPLMGKVDTLADLRVNGADGPIDNVFAAGDCAAVPDLASGEGKFCPPNAQHAVRQGKRIADNIARSVQGRPLVDYYHKNLGTMATLGMYKGVGRLHVADKEFDLRGLPAWAAARAYHVYAMPTFGRKVAVVADWVTNMISRRDIIGIPEQSSPRAAFELAANTSSKPK
ncbi:NAD(P)/FAD-dependent oxidoreductase [Brachybacterium muris]|uniref:NAD(P)/FAD-dependent oxidoreductase n=1 Tax=Brachybacterium muris TaxID=219301 RepID=UPI00195EE858|nr:NAD(P)/FAD-dependent oxidoreductase [Brachybacterium muris]MBM7500374.1 NADH dehydrogenase [Brachybacterium muris]MCT1430137.1 NAD(P)/FAD-dependent oxidoreductase [Brachybacterium muris]MCT1997675.1 NAD(P)/FAD-dependent oxidoreductase [Brachybacterium muris]MCT2177168.1 NAD(P)/FAD-dependent oxidoreductase [Brachybacterium muris]MCT2260630.1 NAD(P)/FAD-dependent oxidoreductase [Brachybacterium muris]